MFEIEPQIRLTEEATDAVKESFREGGLSTEDTRLRIGANYGGCAGWRWEMETEDISEVPEEDQVFESNGISVIVNKEILYNVIGDVVVSYRNISLVEQGFLFVRDNGHACGCGESFSSVIKDYRIEKP
jgi:iron-sulfur cluster assembly protein